MLYKIANKSFILEVNSYGAEANSLVYNSLDILRKKDEIWGRIAPLLFPIVGCLKDGYTIIDGKKYSITKHGFLRDHDLKLVEKTDSKITLVDRYTIDTLKMFPFKYEAYVTYELFDNSVKTTIKIKNVDNVSFKYNIGGHPGFRCPLYDDESFEDYRIVFDREESFYTPTYENDLWNFKKPNYTFDKVKEIKLDYKYFIPDAFVVKGVKSRTVSLLNKKSKGIRFHFDGFNTIAFWTKPNNKYLCFEPWNGYDDLVCSDHDYNKKEELIEIKPGEEKEVSYTIEVI